MYRQTVPSGSTWRAGPEARGTQLMHGIIMKGLKDYVVERYDWNTWRSVQDTADVKRRLYSPVARYPDRHGTELAAATRSLTGDDQADLEFDVGRHLVPSLMQVFGVHVRGVDTGLDVLERARAVVEEALRRKGLGEVAPLPVEGERLDEDTVVVRYAGDHCDGLRGVAVGVGEHYGEAYTVTERTCQGNGGDHCELVVTRAEHQAGGGLAASDD